VEEKYISKCSGWSKEVSTQLYNFRRETANILVAGWNVSHGEALFAEAISCFLKDCFAEKRSQ
jgi:hypothetical protein